MIRNATTETDPFLAVDDLTDRLFKALSAKPRREILSLLAMHAGKLDESCCAKDEVCACVFAEKLGLGASTVSHHMKILMEAELVTSEKRGQWVYYRLRGDTIRCLAHTLDALADRTDRGDS